MPDLIRHPVFFWIPAFAGMTALSYLIAGVIFMAPIRIPTCEQSELSSYPIFAGFPLADV